MGWTSGARIAEDVWKAVVEHIPDTNKEEVAREIVKIFSSEDADTWDEGPEGGLYDTAYPDSHWDDEDDDGREYIMEEHPEHHI